MTALSLAAPSTAAAAGAGLGSAAAGSKLGPAAIAGAGVGALAGVVGWLIGGWAGVLFGSRELFRLARDEEEHEGVRRFTAVSLLITLGFVLTVLLRPEPGTVTLAFLGMVMALGVLHFVWLPRIVGRRHAAELHGDPEAWRVQRTRHRRRVISFLVGTVVGAAALGVAWIRGW